jgi:hypothetical protein
LVKCVENLECIEGASGNENPPNHLRVKRESCQLPGRCGPAEGSGLTW